MPLIRRRLGRLTYMAQPRRAALFTFALAVAACSGTSGVAQDTTPTSVPRALQFADADGDLGGQRGLWEAVTENNDLRGCLQAAVSNAGSDPGDTVGELRSAVEQLSETGSLLLSDCLDSV